MKKIVPEKHRKYIRPLVLLLLLFFFVFWAALSSPRNDSRPGSETKRLAPFQSSPYRPLTQPAIYTEVFASKAGAVNADISGRAAPFRHYLEQLCGISYVTHLPAGTGGKFGEIWLDWTYRNPEYQQNWAVELCYLTGLVKSVTEGMQSPQMDAIGKRQPALTSLMLLSVASVLDRDIESVKIENVGHHELFAAPDANERIVAAAIQLFDMGITIDMCKRLTPETFPFNKNERSTTE